MNLSDEISLNNIQIQIIQNEVFKEANVYVDVMRLDQIHPIISGNKWFKLKYYLQQAIDKNYKHIATFGGAFSNHLLATAYACNKQNLLCIGFIRGEKPEQFSQTLLDVQALNMQLEFVSRDAYSNQKKIIEAHKNFYFIPQGGYGLIGVRGAAEILNLVPDLSVYDYIVCAVGTGTMLAGIANASLPHQQCLGISVMKNNFNLKNETDVLLNNEISNRIMILHDYHFGGYAKYNDSLIEFMNSMLRQYNLPLDFVYTAKAFYAIHHLAEKKYFKPKSKVLFIHSGGLQGNRSLNNKLLYNNSYNYNYTSFA